ncbi:hypothetical protein BC940DRAFT_82113 [Gongronella butleri]|nr:hypothetical protein BC940DRAFT_82113 [Gongronella butleri]
MQWRALTLLFSGVGVIYLASLLQDAPFPHPARIHTRDALWIRPAPNATLLAVDTHDVYQTLVYYGQSDRGKAFSGTGDMKYGLYGKVVLLKKPIQGLLVNETSRDADDWTPVFEHHLRGHITKVTGPPTVDSPYKFALLYHIVRDESPQYFIRVYYQSNAGTIEYKDLILPGTTWIKSFSLEHDSILFSRDPDMYQYRILPLPDKLTAAPHSDHALDIVLSASEMGNPVPPPRDTLDLLERHDNVLSRLYSPVDDTYRVLALDYYKTRGYFYVSIAVADNASLASNCPLTAPVESMWHLRTYESNKDYYNDDELMDYNGVLDMSQLPDRLKMTCTVLGRSRRASSVVFPIARDKFTTLDYTDRLDVLEPMAREQPHLYRDQERKLIPEYYYLDTHNIQKVYDGDIYGLAVSDQGDQLAVWTEHNFIYIYKRGAAMDESQLADGGLGGSGNSASSASSRHSGATQAKDASIRSKRDAATSALDGHLQSLLYYLDKLVGSTFATTSRQDAEAHPDLPSRWQLCQVITPSYVNLRHAKNIAAVTFFNATSSSLPHDGNSYLFVAMKTGAVHSYLIDTMETPPPATLSRFLSGQWDMLMAMCVIIFVFVFNEYQNYGYV